MNSSQMFSGPNTEIIDANDYRKYHFPFCEFLLIIANCPCPSVHFTWGSDSRETWRKHDHRKKKKLAKYELYSFCITTNSILSLFIIKCERYLFICLEIIFISFFIYMFLFLPNFLMIYPSNYVCLFTSICLQLKYFLYNHISRAVLIA